MSKGLETLEKIKRLDILYDIEMTESGEEYMKENDIDLNIIEKELKALEIIRKHFNGVEILTGAMNDKEWKFVKEILNG